MFRTIPKRFNALQGDLGDPGTFLDVFSHYLCFDPVWGNEVGKPSVQNQTRHQNEIGTKNIDGDWTRRTYRLIKILENRGNQDFRWLYRINPL